LLIRGDTNAPTLPDLPDPFESIQLVPAQVIQGKTMVLQIKTATPVGVTGMFMGNPLVVITERDRVTHHVVFGIEALAQPGVYPMDLVAIADSGAQYRFSQLVKVQDGGYAFEQLILAPELADLINPVVTQPELDRINTLVRNFTPQRYFAGPMGLPCSAAMTSPYGTRRSYNNGALNSVHTGADFAGAPGSPIIAPAAGVVVLAEALTVRGNATIIDHGWGVYTGYWHQDTISVKVGDIVQPGQVIGTVGKTGRVTGYHLHWELFVHGVSVDPLQWVQQSFS
jgi:murein DD-endopeptidase MepM/ murein hydrolase activator NlpD